MKLELIRESFTEESTIGRLFIDGVFQCFTLELPYRDNKNNISCIPTGAYHWKQRNSKYSKYQYTHLHLQEVPDRNFILVHKGNYASDTLGCILVGSAIGVDAVWNSKDAFDSLMNRVSEDGTIIISNINNKEN